MIDCDACKKKKVCSICGEQICEVHRPTTEVCSIVGYYNEDGQFICEKCHNNGCK